MSAPDCFYSRDLHEYETFFFAFTINILHLKTYSGKKAVITLQIRFYCIEIFLPNIVKKSVSNADTIAENEKLKSDKMWRCSSQQSEQEIVFNRKFEIFPPSPV